MNLDEARYSTLLSETDPPLINIGTGEDVTVRELAETVAKVLDFKGNFIFDTTKPDGTPRKLLDVTRLHNLGWHHTTTLEQGIRQTWDLVRNTLSN
jgi:GDP-L-fucose synthase